jgi:beta-glucanase (GH16 family)
VRPSSRTLRLRRKYRAVAAFVILVSLLVAPNSASAWWTPPPPTPPAPTCGGEVVAKPTGGNWVCTFDDEFNGTSLDTTKWTPNLTATNGYHSGVECVVNTPNNISESGGYLNLTVRKEAAPFVCKDPSGNYTTQYTAATVTTATTFSQAYGRFEIRALFPAATVAGLQSSLWLYPEAGTKFGAWPLSGEIDIAEEYSQYPDRAIPYIHYRSAATDPNVTNNYCMLNPSTFNVYTAVWTTTSITISYNGTTCISDTWKAAAPLTGAEPFNQPFFVALTQALGINTNVFDAATTPLPATTQIDYVRVWK